MRHILFIAALLADLPTWSGVTAAKAKPNIVLVLMDNLG